MGIIGMFISRKCKHHKECNFYKENSPNCNEKMSEMDRRFCGEYRRWKEDKS